MVVAKTKLWLSLTRTHSQSLNLCGLLILISVVMELQRVEKYIQKRRKIKINMINSNTKAAANSNGDHDWCPLILMVIIVITSLIDSKLVLSSSSIFEKSFVI